MSLGQRCDEILWLIDAVLDAPPSRSADGSAYGIAGLEPPAAAGPVRSGDRLGARPIAPTAG